MEIEAAKFDLFANMRQCLVITCLQCGEWDAHMLSRMAKGISNRWVSPWAIISRMEDVREVGSSTSDLSGKSFFFACLDLTDMEKKQENRKHLSGSSANLL